MSNKEGLWANLWSLIRRCDHVIHGLHSSNRWVINVVSWLVVVLEVDGAEDIIGFVVTLLSRSLVQSLLVVNHSSHWKKVMNNCLATCLIYFHWRCESCLINLFHVIICTMLIMADTSSWRLCRCSIGRLSRLDHSRWRRKLLVGHWWVLKHLSDIIKLLHKDDTCCLISPRSVAAILGDNEHLLGNLSYKSFLHNKLWRDTRSLVLILFLLFALVLLELWLESLQRCNHWITSSISAHWLEVA